MPNSPGLSYQFTHAICREPAQSVASGLRSTDLGDPDPGKFKIEHACYVEALEQAGLKVEVLPPLEAFPDSCFVEDPAFCLPEGAVQLRPGAASRTREGAHIRDTLEMYFPVVASLPEKGFVDGGDILLLDDRILIGLSERTDTLGASVFAEIVSDWGYDVRVVQTPSGVLHFKTACAVLGNATILSTSKLASSGIFDDFQVILVPEDEEYAANVIRINDIVLVPKGYPKTRSLIESAGFKTEPVPTSEAQKLDGGLSCLSLRFQMDI